MRCRFLWFVLAVAAASSAAAQNIQTDPLQCWWRTSSGAVRVGEPFSVVLTCAVIETDAATVVVDQSKLEPSVVQFAPFEVLGGSHGADLRTDLRRFFQYEYRLRLIAENEFGKDVALPEVKLSYRVQSRVGQNAAIQGRDQSYVLPAQSVRILSLVPGDAADIRDTSPDTFADLDHRAFRANLFIVIGGVLFALAGLLVVLALARLVSRLRQPSAATDRFVTDGAILRAAGRELSAVQRARDGAGWSPELAARALASIRVAAAYAAGRRVAQSPNGKVQSSDGVLLVRSGWPRSKRIAVSGSVTPQALAREKALATSAQRAATIESLEQALAQFNAAQYGRSETTDDAGLDAALGSARGAMRGLKIQHSWLMKRLRRQRPPAKADARVWSR